MDKNLREFILNKEHRKLRHRLEIDLASDFCARGLNPADRMSERLEILSKEEKPVVFDGERIAFFAYGRKFA